MTDIQQAKEWAESRVNGNYLLSEGTKEAVKVIQSLPDQWIDADRVREVLDMWAENPFPTSDEVAVLNDFEALLTPPLPTLADMPRPEDVPAGEPWIVESHGCRWVGIREAEGNGPCMWALARLDSKFVDLVFDEHVTLVSRLVPEVKP